MFDDSQDYFGSWDPSPLCRQDNPPTVRIGIKLRELHLGILASGRFGEIGVAQQRQDGCESAAQKGYIIVYPFGSATLFCISLKKHAMSLMEGYPGTKIFHLFLDTQIHESTYRIQ